MKPLLHRWTQPADLDLLAGLERAEGRGHRPGRLEKALMLVEDTMRLCEELLPDLTEGGAAELSGAARHLLGAGGKRVRPLLLALSAHACPRQGDAAPPRPALLSVMASAELLHTATLLHDDVLDVADVRRGLRNARVPWGNSVSVLAGDFMLTRAVRTAMASGVSGILPELCRTFEAMLAGEVLQLSLRGRSDVTREQYRRVVEGKSASLFAFCGRAGALCAGAPTYGDALASYACHVGYAFQIVDDVLDVDGDPAALGKTVLTDVREGKLTLPVLLAIEARPELCRSLNPSPDADAALSEATVALLCQALRESDAVRRSRQAAEEAVDLGRAALRDLPPGPYRNALGEVADELLRRQC